MSSALEERKLRGVYELLDDGNPRLALLELQKHIKRSTPTSANSPLVQAVRCLCLQRTGEETEAMEVFVQMIETEKARLQAEDQAEKEKLEEAQKKEKIKLPAGNKSKGKGKGKGKGGKHVQQHTSEQGNVEETQPNSPDPQLNHDQDCLPSTTVPAPLATENPSQPEDDLDPSPSRQLCGNSLVGEIMFDDRVLGRLAFALKPMRQYDHLRNLHQNSWLSNPEPSNLSNGEQYFFYCVRLGRWREAREVALSLWACNQEKKFTKWAAICSYLQSTDHRFGSPKASRTDEAKAREDDLYEGISLFLHGGSPNFDEPEALLFYLSIGKKLSAAVLGDGTKAVESSEPSEVDVKTGMTKQERTRRAERIMLELLTPSIDRLANVDLEGDEGPEFLREMEEQIKRDRVGGQKAMKDLRFKWARWELVEMVAKREARKSRARADGTDLEEEKEDKSIDWDWEKEWERLDDAIRGAEDLPDTNYKAYICYLAVLDVLRAQGTNASASEPDKYLQATRKTLWAMAEQFGSKERAPLLALLEISNEPLSTSARPEDSKEDHNQNGSLAICEVYWQRFGHKGMAFDDLKSHWPHGDEASGPAAMQLLESLCLDEPTTAEAYARRLNAEKLRRYLLPPQSAQDELKTASVYWNLYLAGAIYSKGLPTTDVRIVDDFGVMAAQAIICAASQPDEGQGQSANDLLLLATLLLEKIVRDSPSSAVGRVLLIRLYRLLGAPSLVMPHVDLLKMRHFQQDTVLHMVTERLSAMATASSEKSRIAQFKLLDACQKTYKETDHEITEGVVACFGGETFSQIEGMLDLRRDLQMSLQQGIVNLEDFKRHVVKGEPATLAASAGDGSQLRDIRDWDLVPDYGSKSSTSSIREKTSAGPIMDGDSIDYLMRAWRKVTSTDRSHGERSDNGRNTVPVNATAAEQALIAFASGSKDLTDAWKRGTATTADLAVTFTAILEAEERVKYGAWQDIHRWTTWIEAWTMFEIVAAPLRPAKKAKKAGKGDNDPVHEGIKATTDAMRNVLRAAAEEAKAALSEDPIFKDGQLARTLLEFGVDDKALTTMTKGVETTIRDSRRTAFKELAAALKRRIES